MAGKTFGWMLYFGVSRGDSWAGWLFDDVGWRFVDDKSGESIADAEDWALEHVISSQKGDSAL